MNRTRWSRSSVSEGHFVLFSKKGQEAVLVVCPLRVVKLGEREHTEVGVGRIAFYEVFLDHHSRIGKERGF